MDYSQGVKRLLLVAVVAGCLPFPNPTRSPLEKHIESQLNGKAEIEKLDKVSSFGVAFNAHRDEEMEFELDAKGNLMRTQVAIPDTALPAAVLAVVPAKRISEAIVVFEHGTVRFWLEGYDEHWIVDANGAVIDHDVEEDDCSGSGEC